MLGGEGGAVSVNRISRMGCPAGPPPLAWRTMKGHPLIIVAKGPNSHHDCGTTGVP